MLAAQYGKQNNFVKCVKVRVLINVRIVTRLINGKRMKMIHFERATEDDPPDSKCFPGICWTPNRVTFDVWAFGWSNYARRHWTSSPTKEMHPPSSLWPTFSSSLVASSSSSLCMTQL